ncbi:MAG: ABC transporter permease [Opitutales bacterium]
MARLLSELAEAGRIAWEQVTAHKLRSLLTALGVIIGTFAITLMGTLIKGVDRGFEQSLALLGTDTFYVERMPWRVQGNQWWLYRNRPPIEAEYAESLNEWMAEIPHSKLVVAVPAVTTDRSVRRIDRQIEGIQITGTNSDFAVINTAELAYGRFFSPSEALAGRNVAVIGWEVAEALFPAGPETAPGEEVMIARRKFEVIGVSERQGSFLGLQSFDKQVVMPMAALRKFYNRSWNNSNSIRIARLPEATNQQAIDEITGLMRRVRQLMPGEDNDFEINQSQAIEDQLGPIKQGIAGAGLFITGLALFVGAIGIMNITFVSVKERTQEIGTRRALGARRRSILIQFLIEAVTICLAGGLVGMTLSFIARFVLETALPDFPVVFSLDLVLFAVTASVLTGVISGFAPAWQASRLDPAEALRHD